TPGRGGGGWRDRPRRNRRSHNGCCASRNRCSCARAAGENREFVGVTMAAGRRKRGGLLEKYKADDQIVFSPLASCCTSSARLTPQLPHENGVSARTIQKR